jgi:hypothetical protein
MTGQNRHRSTVTINTKSLINSNDSTNTGFNYDYTICEDFSNIPDLCTIKEFGVEDEQKAHSQS